MTYKGRYDSQDGNWMSGISSWMNYGFARQLPERYYKIRNTYYFLPFL
jgi:hypothetical protein